MFLKRASESKDAAWLKATIVSNLRAPAASDQPGIEEDQTAGVSLLSASESVAITTRDNPRLVTTAQKHRASSIC